MKTKEAVELYEAYKAVKFSGMETAHRFISIENMRRLKPVYEAFESARTSATDKLKPDGYDDLEEFVMQNDGKKVSGEDAEKVREYYTMRNRLNSDVGNYILGVYDKAQGKRIGGLHNEEVTVELKKIPQSAFEKMIENNPDVSTEHLCVLSELVE